jgi:hypothetical protein
VILALGEGFQQAVARRLRHNERFGATILSPARSACRRLLAKTSRTDPVMLVRDGVSTRHFSTPRWA